MTQLLSPDELEAALRRIGDERYHNRHPFHHLLHGGKLNKGQVQAWALNRYYYQARIPRKDASLVARLPTTRSCAASGASASSITTAMRGHRRDRALAHADRRARPRSRLRRLAPRRAAGDPVRGRRLCPFRARPQPARGRRLVADRAVLADHHRRARLGHAGGLFDFVSRDTLAYFTPRLTQAPRDVDFALDYVKREARTVEQQQAGSGLARVQVRRALGAARRALSRLCRARPHPARRLPAR